MNCPICLTENVPLMPWARGSSDCAKHGICRECIGVLLQQGTDACPFCNRTNNNYQRKKLAALLTAFFFYSLFCLSLKIFDHPASSLLLLSLERLLGITLVILVPFLCSCMIVIIISCSLYKSFDKIVLPVYKAILKVV